jgi:hypothetical protein
VAVHDLPMFQPFESSAFSTGDKSDGIDTSAGFGQAALASFDTNAAPAPAACGQNTATY